MRIVDAEVRLLVGRETAPEQALKPEDMQLVVEAVNAVPLLLAEIDRLSRLEMLANALEDDERHGNLTGRAEDAYYRWKAEAVDFDALYEDKENR